MKAVFLDRDGVINRKKEDGYITSRDEFIFLPLVFEGLKLLSDNGYRLFIITNQQGIGKRLFTTRQLEKIHTKMKAGLLEKGIRIKRIYFCPHRESEACDCRKPATGMIKRAIKEFPDVDLKKSYLIGDSITDIETGYRMGIKTILISTRPGGSGTDSSSQAPGGPDGFTGNGIRLPDYIKKDLFEAANLIVDLE